MHLKFICVIAMVLKCCSGKCKEKDLLVTGDRKSFWIATLSGGTDKGQNLHQVISDKALNGSPMLA